MRSIYGLEREGPYKCQRCRCSSYNDEYLHRIFYNDKCWHFGIYCRRCWALLSLSERLTGYSDWLNEHMPQLRDESWPKISRQIWQEWANPAALAPLEQAANHRLSLMSYSPQQVHSMYTILGRRL